ncbi:MAG: TonB-dependent receptor, partial [Vicinamibacterales bacterium]
TGRTNDFAISGSWTGTLGARTTNELCGQFAARRADLHTNGREGAGISIAGVADFGPAYAGDNTHDQRYFEAGDTVGYSRASHFLKAGANLQHVSVGISTADGTRGLYVFPTLDAFLAGQPAAMRQMSGGADVDLTVTRASAFVQDYWTPTPGITVDAGARFETSLFPSSFGITNRRISPRVGIAWMPDRQWVIRGGAGAFADRLVLAALERPTLGQQGIVERSAAGEGATPSMYTVRRGAFTPYSRQASVGAERQLSANLTAAMNYLFVQGRNLARTINVNLAPPRSLTVSNAVSLGIDAAVPQQLGRLVFGRERLDPSWNGVFELQPTASSSYHGVTMTLNRRLADEIEWSAAYTWSHAQDAASDFDEQPQNPYALTDEWDDSRYDQRHRLVISAVLDLPIGEEEDLKPGQAPGAMVRAFSHISVAPILTAGTGHPINIVTGGDDNRTGAFPITSRPINVRRNSWRLPATATLDIRVLKYFAIKPHGKLDLVVEAFNLLNRTNVIEVNNIFGPLLTPRASFGRAIEAGPSRQLQFSIDFEF